MLRVDKEEEGGEEGEERSRLLGNDTSFITWYDGIRDRSWTSRERSMSLIDPDLAHLKRMKKLREHEESLINRLLAKYPVVLCCSIYVMWTLLGTSFYHYYDKFAGPTAFFYAMEAGLSVGFCNPQEKDDTSKLFTIFYILLGGSLIAGSFGVILSEATKLRGGLSPYLRDMNRKVVPLDDDIGNITLIQLCKYVWFQTKVFVGWYEDPSRIKALLLLLGAIMCGTIIASQDQDWTLISSVYWAVTTLSTAGLQSPDCENGSGTTCNISSTTALTMGFFMMVGIPIYAVALGKLAQMVLEYTTRQHQLRLLNKPILREEIELASSAFSPTSANSLGCSDYILLELLRCGITKETYVYSLKKRFDELDARKTGFLMIPDLVRAGLVTVADSRQNGYGSDSTLPVSEKRSQKRV